MDTLVVALVGGLVGGTVAALIGGYVTLQVQGRQHEHERAMAREARLQERRVRAYELALEHAYRLEAWVARTEPFFGWVGAPGPPEPLPDEAMFRLNALSAAHASAAVQAVARAMTQAAHRFETAAWRVRAERESPLKTEEPGPTAWTDLEAKRTAFHEALAAFSERINEDLRE